MSLSPVLPYTMAPDLLAKVHGQTANLVGAIIKDNATGRILGHVQPTRVAESLFSSSGSLLGGLGGAPNPISALIGGINIVQNEQIKNRLSEMSLQLGRLQAVQFLTLATTLVGVGVTAISTALMLRRMRSLQSSIDTLSQKLDRVSIDLAQRPVQGAIRAMQTCAERYEELPTRSATASTTDRIEADLDYAQAELRDGFKELALKGIAGVDDLMAILSALTLGGALQIKILVRVGELALAEHRAARIAKGAESLAWDLPRDVLQERLGRGAKVLSSALHESHGLQESQPALLRSLRENGVSGPDYLKQIEQAEGPLFLIVRPEPNGS